MDGWEKLVRINRIALESAQMRVEHWLLTQVLIWDTLVQIPVILVVLAVAWLLARPTRWRARRRVALRSRWMERSLKILTYAAIRHSFPIIAVVLLWACIGIAGLLGQARGLLVTVATLLAAWVAIRLATRVIRNEVLAWTVAIFAWSLAALIVVDLLEPAVFLLDRVAIRFGDFRLSLLNLLKAAIALSVFLWVATVAAGIVERRVREARHVTPSAQVLIGKLVKIVLIGVAILVALNTVGIDVTALAVFTGAIGLGLGFGLQKVVSNLVSGVILLMDRSIKPGDVIEVGETFGWVAKLGARYVAVTTRDGKDWLIPNEDLITQRVTNWSYSDHLLRLRLPFGVSYQSDPRRAMALAVEAARENPRVLKDPPPVCRMMAFGESAVELELRIWIDDPQSGIVNVRSDVLLAIWDKLHAAGIAIPFPQRDVHIRADSELRVALSRPPSSSPRPGTADLPDVRGHPRS